MKNLIKLLFCCFLFSSLTGCIKNDEITFKSTMVEIDWASFSARTSGYPFTLFSRIPGEPGRGLLAADASITRLTIDTIRMRINLVGPQQSTPQSFQVGVSSTFTTGIEGSATTPGAHFQLIDRIVTIPANSSFGFCRWVVRNPGVASPIPVSVIFQLKGNSTIPVMENFQFIGWSIAQ